MNRYELAQAIAIDRVEYERDVRAQGYRDDAFQALIPFCMGVVKQMARGGTKIAGVSHRRDSYGDVYHLDVDFKRLAKRVERQLPMWREVAARVALEEAVAALPDIDEAVAA